VHSSTVTVVVRRENIGDDTGAYRQRTPDDFKLEWFNGTIKAGGQHHQKNATCCRLTHLPTGTVRTAQTRSRNNSQHLATVAMTADLDRLTAEADRRAMNAVRRDQVGNGERSGVKRRTWRLQEDAVLDHVTGRRARASDVMRGRFELLWV
jgi:peptide chain release factor 1